MYKTGMRKGVFQEKLTNQCYYCEQLFSSKEKLYNHLEDHSVLKEKKIKFKKKTVKKKDIKKKATKRKKKK
jgi:hypothetical protein